MLGELFYGKRKQSEWKDKPVRACEVLKKCDVAYVLLPVVLIQLFLLHLEFNGGLQTGGFKKNLCSDQPCTQRIPKIIHQTYKTEDIPPNWESTPQAWKKHHPGWKYMFWTDERNRKLIQDHYEWFLPTYDGYPYGIQRSDAARYFILHKYGGVYADLDIQPLRSVSEILGDAELVLPQTPNLGLTNAFMASVNGSDFMAHIISILPEHANKWYQVVRHWHIMTSAGPTFLWAQYERWTGDKSRSLIVPAAFWGKCSICKSRCKDLETSPLHHLTGNSWFAVDSFIFNYILMCNPVPLAVVVLFLIDVYKTGRYKHWMYGARSADQNKKMIIPGGFLGFSFMTKWIAFFSFGAVLYYLKQRP